MTIESHSERDRQIRTVTLWGGLLNIVLMAIKVVSGFLVSSSALVADGIHSLSDLATDFIILVSSRVSNRPADKTHPYGHKRFETLAAQVIAMVLFVVSIGLIWSAARSILQEERYFPGPVVLIIALISVFSKEIIFRITRKVSRATQSASLYANAWHHRSDALSSVAVLIGGIASLFGWGMADQAATIVVGFMIMAVSVKILYEGLIELSEHSADEKSIQTIESILSDNKDISEWHALRTRRVGGELFIDLHILVDPDLSVQTSHDMATKIEKQIKDAIAKPVNILIHIEPDIQDRHKYR